MTDTKELIIREFMKEYAEREDGAVTVKGLCASVPVARTTFYSYFGNTDDILQAVEDELISGLASIADHVSGGNLPDMDFRVFMDAVEDYIRRHWSDIHALLVDRPDQRFIRRWKEAMKDNFRRRYPGKQDGKNSDAIAEIMVSSLISAYTYWMEHPDTPGIDEIKNLMMKLLDSLVSYI